MAMALDLKHKTVQTQATVTDAAVKVMQQVTVYKTAAMQAKAQEVKQIMAYV